MLRFFQLIRGTGIWAPVAVLLFHEFASVKEWRTEIDWINKVSSVSFDLPCIKDGIHYARPPEFVLKQLLAVRLHLDDCDETNGPLRVSPGTHNFGIMETAAISDLIARHGEATCIAKKGELVLMRPLILHASSQATEPKHRRILHFVYFSGEPIKEPWHRAV